MTQASAEGRRGDLEFGTIGRLARIAADRFGDATAIEEGDVTLSFADLARDAERAAAGLIALGVRHGDRVAIWAPNLWEWVVAALGVHTAGAVLVPVNTRFKGEEAAYLLSKSRARVLITVGRFLDTDYLSMLRRAEQSLFDLEHTVLLRGGTSDVAGPSRTVSWAEMLRGGEGVTTAEVAARAEAVAPSDLCDIIFTSGTTGYPKGVMSTHAQTLRAFRDWSDIVGLRAGDRYLVVAPFFHSFGYKAGWLSALMMGATVLPQTVFDVGSVLERIGPDRVSVVPGPPALYQSILAREDYASFDLGPLRLAVTGAAVIPVELIRRMRSELGFDTVLTGYGLTEGTGVSTLCREGDDPEVIATTSGRAIPGVEVRVVDADDQPVPSDSPGEVQIRGYSVMSGYFEDEAQTAETIDAEGWLRTGDIGSMDARGYLRVFDRKKDMFIVGGFNTYPAEIENLLLRHPDVAQAAVVGVADDRLGEVGFAFVVPKGGRTPAEGDLIDFCRERLANFKVPRQVALVDDLPRNATGKVLKYRLREQARHQRSYAPPA